MRTNKPYNNRKYALQHSAVVNFYTHHKTKIIASKFFHTESVLVRVIPEHIKYPLYKGRDCEEESASAKISTDNVQYLSMVGIRFKVSIMSHHEDCRC